MTFRCLIDELKLAPQFIRSAITIMDHPSLRGASEQEAPFIRNSARHDSDTEQELEARGRKKGDRKTSRQHRDAKDPKERKGKKQKKDSERDRDRNQGYDITEVARSDPTTIEDSTAAIVSVVPVPVTKVDFFASLVALESLKPAVGTIHTVAKKIEAEKKTGSWTCPKCSTSNMNNSHQCHKCKAIKRMTEYR